MIVSIIGLATAVFGLLLYTLFWKVQALAAKVQAQEISYNHFVRDVAIMLHSEGVTELDENVDKEVNRVSCGEVINPHLQE